MQNKSIRVAADSLPLAMRKRITSNGSFDSILVDRVCAISIHKVNGAAMYFWQMENNEGYHHPLVVISDALKRIQVLRQEPTPAYVHPDNHDFAWDNFVIGGMAKTLREAVDSFDSMKRNPPTLWPLIPMPDNDRK